MYTLNKKNLTVLSTKTITDIGTTINAHNEQFFKDHEVDKLKLSTFFVDKQFQIKQRGDNTCMIDYVWHNCRNKKGFQKYTYQKLSHKLREYAAHFPMMSTHELVEWAKTCNPNVSIHAYDLMWRKFMKHIPQHGYWEITLVFYIKNHHLYPTRRMLD